MGIMTEKKIQSTACFSISVFVGNIVVFCE